MLWLLPAALALSFGAYQTAAGERRWAASNAILFYVSLIFFIVSQAGQRAFVGSETSLLGYFVAGLALLAAGEALTAWWSKAQARWAQAAPPLAAASFALGFDVLRPDAYSYVPAAILGALVLVAAWRVYGMLARGLKRKQPRWPLAASVAAFAVMIYAGAFKTMDRGWLLPWSYLAAVGALVWAAVQLRAAAVGLLRRKAPPAWLLGLLGQLAVAMMVLAAWFVYRAFL
jgi:hypothetical protein